jgi:nitroimidazol reductase NimA-like FMN-containing flavoprotein (pyridoxamine 5'-phosphate oxidase superfamily)
MTTEEIDGFLAEPGHLLRIGVVDEAGMPLVVPIWFIARDGALWFTPREKSRWLAHLRSNPRICCTIDESRAGSRKLVVRGRAEIVHDVGEDDAWRDLYREITLRYTPEAWGDAYLQDTIQERRALLRVPLAGSEVHSWRMPFREGEDPLAVWAPRYYRGGRGRAGREGPPAD